MHFVLWGLHQLMETRQDQWAAMFQCTSCFGVFINFAAGTFDRWVIVSMHFVLWGLHQHEEAGRAIVLSMFQCTSCFGVFINWRFIHPGNRRGKFQCTSCFGVFINLSGACARQTHLVSMHFVLWGLHQLGDFDEM